MKVLLSSVGNPDHRQDPNAPLYGCDPDRTVEVDSFEMASAQCISFIHHNDMGGGNWSGGDITKDGKLIAYVSYNGRVWKVTNGEKYSNCKEEIEIDKEKVREILKID